MAAIAACLAAGACSDPPLKIIYEIQEGDTGQGCNTSNCGEIFMTCDAVLHLRILNPADPDLPYVSICEEVQPNNNKDLCAIGRIDLPVTELPRETLEVQVTVWRKEFVTVPGTDKLDCLRTPVQFDAIYGFPITATPSEGPAFGGRAFYHPGDAETIVTLGCTNQASINAASCSGMNSVAVNGTVVDFENLLMTVSTDTASTLAVSVGIPKLIENTDDFALNAGEATMLQRVAGANPPSWTEDVTLPFESAACLLVDEDVPQSTTTVKCIPASQDDQTLDIQGMRVTPESLAQILDAVNLSALPEDGLTLGIVLDEFDAPAAGATITAAPGGTIEIINANRTGTVPGNVTTASGLFVSRDAPFGTFFGAQLITPLAPRLGGRIRNKLTIVLFTPEGIGN